jgi:integrase
MAKQTIEGFPACGSQRLTDKYVQGLDLPATGTMRVWDTHDPKKPKLPWCSGFGVRLSSGGSRSFILRYRNAKGEDKIYTIGDWPTWSMEAARNEAFDLKRRIVKGGDPLAEKQADREAPTVAVLADRFMAEHANKKRPKTAKGYQQAIDKDIKPALGKRRVDAVDFKDIEDLHRAITERGSPYTANRVTACASKMFSLAVKWRMRPDNPCKGIDRNGETKRKRYATNDEISALTKALDAYGNQGAANGVRLLLLTGARTMEVLSARWEQFDLERERGTWTKPASTTKTKSEHIVPLSKEALELLRQMREAAGDSPFLFPGDQSGHVGNPKKHWSAICKTAGISGLRVHDLRHSYASLLVSSGHGLPVIGELLGHANIATTARYAHLIDDVARAATDRVGARLAGLVAKRPGKRKPLKVVDGGKR